MAARIRTASSLAMLAVAALLIAALLTPVAGAAPNKPFSADVLPTCVAGGSTTGFTLTLRNETATQRLGSANVTPPNGFVLLSATPPASVASGNILALRNLNVGPGGVVTVSFSATTPSTPGEYSWNRTADGSSIIAKQANDYNGPPGNDLTFRAATSHVSTFVGTCELIYVTQPQDAEVFANITSVQFAPAGAPVQIAVEDGFGNVVTTFVGSISLGIVPGTGTSGTSLIPAVPSVAAVGGLATFDASEGTGFAINAVGLSYRLRASAGAGVEAVDSFRAPGDPGFDVVNDGVICTGPGCNGSASRNGVSVTVTAPNALAGDVIVIALDVETLNCEGYDELTDTVVTFEVTGDSYRIVTIRVPASPDLPPASQDRVCYSSALPFTDRSGNENVTTGLLADCRNRTPLSEPCQFQTVVDRDTGDHIVSFRAPPGSTRGRG
jgi:hypothetical protein